jgi:ferric-dicitrate binding protein FerR (iron transport regulator)
MDKSAMIFKVLSGEANELEKKELDIWITQSDANREEFNDLKLLWESSREEAGNDHHFYESLYKIQAQIRQRQRRKRSKPIVLIGLAAIGLIGLLLYFIPLLTLSSDNLRFNNAPLRLVVGALESKYHIQIEAERKEILACQFTGSFYMVDNPQDAIRSICSALNLKYEIMGKGKYRLTGFGCAQQVVPGPN